MSASSKPNKLLDQAEQLQEQEQRTAGTVAGAGKNKTKPAPTTTAKTKNKITASPPMLLLGSPPHIHAAQTVPQIMKWVIIAMVPAILASFWFFGLEAVRVVTISVIACVGLEYLCLRFMKTPGSLGDLSALVTGLLLAMNLPPTAPWWLIVAGAAVAIVITKQLFGGIGANIFNPALTARVFLLVAWPGHMTTWLKPGVRHLVSASDLAAGTVTGATPLAALMNDGAGTQALELTPLSDLFWGNVGGSLGEVSAIALIIGGIIMIRRRVIPPPIPVAYLGSVFIITMIAKMVGGDGYADPLWHIMSGGLLLGALFMATDMVTTPLTMKGKIVFGLGCGVLTAVIRLWSGGYPEGISFSILIMNGLTPLIDSYFKPTTFGSRQRAGQGASK